MASAIFFAENCDTNPPKMPPIIPPIGPPIIVPYTAPAIPPPAPAALQNRFFASCLLEIFPDSTDAKSHPV